MILGMSPEAFTFLHVILSLVGIATGFVVSYGFCTANAYPRWAAWFLASTVLTSATGFLFHSPKIGPPHIIGALSMIVLSIALYALYGAGLAGRWRGVYVTTCLIALYFNVFVGVVQAFQKLPVLHGFAPTGTEAPFVTTQLIVLAAFVVLGVGSVRRFHPIKAVG